MDPVQIAFTVSLVALVPLTALYWYGLRRQSRLREQNREKTGS